MASRCECKACGGDGFVYEPVWGPCPVCDSTGVVDAGTEHAGATAQRDDGIYDEDGLRIGTVEPKAPPSVAGLRGTIAEVECSIARAALDGERSAAESRLPALRAALAEAEARESAMTTTHKSEYAVKIRVRSDDTATVQGRSAEQIRAAIREAL